METTSKLVYLELARDQDFCSTYKEKFEVVKINVTVQGTEIFVRDVEKFDIEGNRE